MASNKLYTGIVLEDDYLKIARISVTKKKATLVYLNKVKLVENIDKSSSSQPDAPIIFDSIDDSLQEDNIFGIEADSTEDSEKDALDLEKDDFDLEIDLDDLDEESQFGEIDMAEDSGDALPATNELLIYNLLSGFSVKKVNFALNIPAGGSIFQILKDVDFANVKKKDINIIVDDRLESVYSMPKGKDYYSYNVRDDGALLLASIDDTPQVLSLINRASGLYRGNVFIDEILPDEALLIGLIRANYTLEADEITSVIQYGETYCRILFMKGKELSIVSPIITDGSKSKRFLNTVFSKILFQLDTGEVPNLDRILLCNNTLGDEAVDFLQERFPDIDVSEFNYNEDVFDLDKFTPTSIAPFTTAIGAAWTSAGFHREKFPKISFLPESVKDRQKIFKLQWHGFLLLFLIFITPFIFNHYYLKNITEINSLEESVRLVKKEVANLEPTVAKYNQTTQDLAGIQSRLELLDELSKGTLRWSVNLDILNRGFNDIGSIWLTSLSTNAQNQSIQIDGYSLYKNRVSMLADIFNEAVLQDVNRSIIREKDLYSFRYLVKKIVADENMYTPESAKGLQQVLGGNN
ncbi:MAG: hypothetical protein WC967_03720 [Balneolaceae bacterium]